MINTHKTKQVIADIPNQSDKTTERLICLVSRNKTGCQQYPFETIEELEKWTNRKPYRDEIITVMPIYNDNSVAKKRQMQATAAPDFIRTFMTGAIE